MNIAVIQFPGSNCERETKLALKRSGLTPVDFFWNSETETLEHYQGFVIVGGFSFEDRIRSGLIASKNPLIKALKKESLKGKPILGICNGAQILVESGLVPGNDELSPSAALTHNIRQQNGDLLKEGFHNAYCRLKPFALKESHAFTNQFKPGESIRIPFANAEGRFVLDDELLDELIHSESQLLQYCDSTGTTCKDYPVNPNGSTFNLAAISNKQGNVMAIMPHPERTEDGQIIFDSMRHYLETFAPPSEQIAFRHKLASKPLSPWQDNPAQPTLLIDAVIEDNAAKTLELLLKNEGFQASVKRYGYYQLESSAPLNSFYKKLEESEVLWNANKEFGVKLPPSNSIRVLVARKEKSRDKALLKSLQTHFHLKEISKLFQGTLYDIEALDGQSERLKNYLISEQLLFNPLVEDGYDYSFK
jgi:phosphoribosylformylglycinamidine synthase